MEEGSSNRSPTNKELREKIKQLQETLTSKPLNNSSSLCAPQIFEEIVSKCSKYDLPPEICEEAAKILAEHLKSSKIFKKRKLAQKISQLSLLSKILFVRQFLDFPSTGVSTDSCLSKIFRSRGIRDGLCVFSKPSCKKLIAYGDNKCGRLGVGSDEKFIENLTPVKINDSVISVVFGKYHTIFLTKEGEVYGCGRARNFLEGPVDPKLNISTPQKLNFLKIKPRSNLFPNVILTDSSTKIVNLNSASSLIIGKDKEIRKEDVKSSGDNWKITKKKSGDENPKIASKTVRVETHAGVAKWITVYDDANWLTKKRERLPIVFLVDGFRIDPEKVWKRCSFSPDGKVMASTDNSIFTGKLMLVPRARQTSDDDSSSEDDGDVEGGESSSRSIKESGDCDPDIQVLPSSSSSFRPDDHVLMAVLEELIMPFSVENIAYGGDGKTFITFPDLPESVRSKSVELFEPIHAVFSHSSRPERMPIDSNDVLRDFSSLMSKFDDRFYSNIYDETGLPLLPEVLSLIYCLDDFVRIDEDGVPVVLKNNFLENGQLSTAGVEEDLKKSKRLGIQRIPIISVKTDWFKTERVLQISAKIQSILSPVISNIHSSLEKFVQIPLIYRKGEADGQFGNFVFHLILQLTGAVEVLDLNIISRHSLVKASVIDAKIRKRIVEKAIKERIESGDINLSDERFRLIRVEGVGVIGSRNQPSEHFGYHINTARIIIQCIDQSLLEKIDEMDVLNLNIACRSDESPERFRYLMDAFFFIHDDVNNSRRLDIEKATTDLDESEKYAIKTSDGTVCKVPKIFFEIFSAFDAARRRTALQRNTDVNSFELNFSEKAIKLAMECLVDSRVFWNADMDLKIEVYSLVRFGLFTQIQPELLRIIIQTAEEEDSALIADLAWTEPGIAIEMMTRNRPEMFLYWKNQPIKGNFWETMKIVTEFLEARNYKHFPKSLRSADIPVIVTRDSSVDSERINPRWLRKFLSDDSVDGDIQWDLVNAIRKWEKENPILGKRTHEQCINELRMHQIIEMRTNARHEMMLRNRNQ